MQFCLNISDLIIIGHENPNNKLESPFRLNNIRIVTLFRIRRKGAGLDPFFAWVRIFVVLE
jgi:hypothetical protein